jgi:hypothetical protein
MQVHMRQGGLRHTSMQAPAVVDAAGADFPAAHCTGSQTRQDITSHARQDHAQLLGQPALNACKPRHKLVTRRCHNHGPAHSSIYMQHTRTSLPA